MNFISLIRKFAIVAALAIAPAASFAGVFISVGFAPPALPVYTQPICPGDGYLWNPGYWAYGDDGYYWVPGVWVQPPSVGVLWTPGYWGWGGGAYIFHEGYWGPHVGFYGGINYGFGFGGFGFSGGEWRGNSFAYNTAYTNVNTTVIHNTYINKTTINNTTINNSHTSFNGGTGGVQARPTAEEARAEHENHIPPTSVQQSHIQAARAVPANFAKANGGHPAMAAIQRPGAMNTAVAARGANVPQRAASPQGRDVNAHNQAPVDRTANNGRTNQPDRQQFNQRQNNAATQANARPAYQAAPRQQAAAPRQQFAPRQEPQAAPRQQAAPRAEPRPQAAPRPESRPQSAPHAESHPAPHAEPHGEGNRGHR